MLARQSGAMRLGGAAVALQQRGFAENLKTISMRIKSTKSIRKVRAGGVARARPWSCLPPAGANPSLC